MSHLVYQNIIKEAVHSTYDEPFQVRFQLQIEREVALSIQNFIDHKRIGTMGVEILLYTARLLITNNTILS